eukprot:TRINITY_DN1929_c0_g1_i1.p1 TRINITY_DN1929_c0_g1~~TRINITY_DN1929_c0_g1_i1.p1  ORF type:complete len:351 (-),score=63.07 TRINITY_DN1929_c0_g1_i1:939-1943(-)
MSDPGGLMGSRLSGMNNPFVDLPRLSKMLAGFVSVLALLGVTGSWATPLFALNPGLTFTGYVWNIVTSGFFENSFFAGLINAALVLLFGKYLEPIWGPAEFLRFVTLVNTISGVMVMLFLIFMYAVTMNPYYLYNVNLCGFAGVLMAFTVALKQLVPEQEVSVFVALSMRAKTLPILSLVISITLFLLGFQSKSLPHTICGMVVSWCYLRFYQRKGDVRGDLNESFAFATFFPEPVQPPIRVASNIVFKLFKTIGFYKNIGTGNSYSTFPRGMAESSGHMLGGGSVADMERRRSIAVKALEQRMAQAPSSAPSASPTTEHSPHTSATTSADENV